MLGLLSDLDVQQYRFARSQHAQDMLTRRRRLIYEDTGRARRSMRGQICVDEDNPRIPGSWMFSLSVSLRCSQDFGFCVLNTPMKLTKRVA